MSAGSGETLRDELRRLRQELPRLHQVWEARARGGDSLADSGVGALDLGAARDGLDDAERAYARALRRVARLEWVLDAKSEGR